eukprot:TRINITY_DN10849_c0_g1_i1.p1 TRINITY_DN10849_c0_g1~~TRINITY_DN10849_c0_g1_i1.p1  ORF type:complete len:137 (-),score=7.56 TRINITY_DN10849_c0_g1_i1:699-1109(-)
MGYFSFVYFFFYCFLSFGEGGEKGWGILLQFDLSAYTTSFRGRERGPLLLLLILFPLYLAVVFAYWFPYLSLFVCTRYQKRSLSCLGIEKETNGETRRRTLQHQETFNYCSPSQEKGERENNNKKKDSKHVVQRRI